MSMTLPATTIGGYVLGIANALEQQGIDSEAVLRTAGFEQKPHNDPLDRVPHPAISRLFKACIEATGDPYFGITVSRYFNISNFHAVGYSLAASNTLMDMCMRIERYVHMVSQVGVVHLESSETEVRLVTEFVADICYETQDAGLTFILRLMRSLYKSSFNPERVELVRPIPEHGAQPFVDFFRAPVSFGHEKATLYFDYKNMHAPLVGASPELAQYNDNLIVKYWALLDRKDVVMLVRAKIIELLPSAKVSKQIVASHLNMSANNLQLKLAEQNTSYTKLYDDVRKDIACNYIQQQNASISEVAYFLGFTDTSNFTRAFKRWMGVSPSDFRDKKNEA